jgi:hypothetical protein
MNASAFRESPDLGFSGPNPAISFSPGRHGARLSEIRVESGCGRTLMRTNEGIMGARG